MTGEQFRTLREGSEVMFLDGTRGVCHAEPGYEHTFTIKWADGEHLVIRTDRQDDREWAETNLTLVKR